MTPSQTAAPAYLRALWRVRPALLASGIARCSGLARRRPLATSQGTFWLSPASYLGMCLLQYGAYEPDMCRFLAESLRLGDVFLDIGANEGYLSVLASKLVGVRGRVIAVEPQRRLAPVIRKNLELNGCENVVLIEALLGAQDGEGLLTLSPASNNGGSSEHPAGRLSWLMRRQRTRVITLDTLFREQGLERVDVAKVDIEGGEWDMLLIGKPRILAERRIGLLSLDVHESILRNRGVDPEDLRRYVRACGYQPATLYSWVWEAPARRAAA
ncbi:MAG TPA: FkbM family methyltransferase [Bryobacteraceae bacterium]|nr:FkbM family methyltransferase [Bryobacteraceae bacterium]